MKIERTPLSGILVVHPKAHQDSRGFFVETWQENRYQELGIPDSPWAQDNVSCSEKGVLRGLHYQFPRAQGKLVTVLEGEIFDVAVDIRFNSPTFGKAFFVRLSSKNLTQLWVPKGFAHGFLVLSPTAVVSYKASGLYYPEEESSILWNDPDLQIPWPLEFPPRLSAKDLAARPLREIPSHLLPVFAP